MNTAYKEPRDRFELKEEHIKLLRATNVSWDNCEFGAPCIDPKRPYGNSSVVHDIAEILDLDVSTDEAYYEHEEYCKQLHKETQTALQIVLSTGSFEPGIYTCRKYSYNWVKDTFVKEAKFDKGGKVEVVKHYIIGNGNVGIVEAYLDSHKAYLVNFKKEIIDYTTAGAAIGFIEDDHPDIGKPYFRWMSIRNLLKVEEMEV